MDKSAVSIAAMVASLLKEAVPLHQQGKLQDAQFLYEKVLELSPRQFDALHLLGVIARQQGKAALAVDLISQALRVDASQAQPHCNLGAALQDLGRSADALASYEQALRRNPDYELALCNRGNALRKLGRKDEALLSYDRALAIRPAYPEAWCNRAIVLQELGRSEQALASADQALAGRPAYPEALRARGDALQSLGRLADAAECYEHALAIKGDDAELYCALGTALQRLHYVEDALQCYDRAIALQPDYAAAHQFRANTCLSLGRRDEALAAYRQALALGGNAEQIGFALASLGAEPAPAGAPATYVKALFDQYAEHFDEHLVEVLEYKTPAVLDAVIARHGVAGLRDTLDLGCGTGLCAPYLRRHARTLTGVDLSEKMLVKAGERGLYDQLACQDIGAFLVDKKDAFDLVVAADVFVYFGDLAAPFALVREALRADGHFCLSVEDSDGPDVMLSASNRYAHGLPYLRRVADASGFALLEAQRTPLRSENGVQVMGYAIMLGARQGAASPVLAARAAE